MQATEDIIGHQVNCQGAMNSGVAKSIRETFPRAYKEYRELTTSLNGVEDTRKSLLGEIQYVRTYGKWIANLFGQYAYGYDQKQYTSPAHLYRCFKELREKAEERNMSVALPYMIGCYRGGADWKEVEGLLLTAFEGYEVTLYKLHKG